MFISRAVMVAFVLFCAPILLLRADAAAAEKVEDGARPRTATLNDARGVWTPRSVESVPGMRAFSYEVGGELVVFDPRAAPKEIARFSGSGAAWAPNGKMLAYLRKIDGGTQIFLRGWPRGADSQLTTVEGGVSPNPFGFLRSNRTIAWSADSKRLAFLSRVLPAGAPGEPSDSIRVFGPGSTLTGVTEGLYRQPERWKRYHEGKLDSFALDRMSAVMQNRNLGLNRLFVVDVATRDVREISSRTQLFDVDWSPDGRHLAAIEDDSPHFLDNAEGNHTSFRGVLALIDARTGAIERFAPCAAIVGMPKWSMDGNTIAMLVRHRPLGYTKLVLFDVRSHEWEACGRDVGHSLDDLSWRGKRLLVMFSDRFVERLGELDARHTTIERATIP